MQVFKRTIGKRVIQAFEFCVKKTEKRGGIYEKRSQNCIY